MVLDAPYQAAGPCMHCRCSRGLFGSLFCVQALGIHGAVTVLTPLDKAVKQIIQCQSLTPNP